MTDAPYPPLRPQRPVRPRRRSRSWPVIIGVILLASLAAILILLLLGDRGLDPLSGNPSDDPSDVAGPSASISSAPIDPTASGSASSAPSNGRPDPSALTIDSIVSTTVERISVRSGPSVDAERLGSVELGTVGFVVDGPVDADGFRWYQVSALGLPPNTGCTGPFVTDPYNCPAWFGWLAGAGENGDPWLATHEIECPDPSSLEELALGRTALERLACFGSESFVFRAWWPEMPDDAGPGGACVSQDAPSGWLLCQSSNDNGVTIGEDQGFGGIGVSISIDPAIGVAMPPRGRWLELRVHLDDPAAQSCGDDAAGTMAEERVPEEWVLFCRSELVVESVAAVDGP